jgi:hypothetical protein
MFGYMSRQKVINIFGFKIYLEVPQGSTIHDKHCIFEKSECTEAKAGII